MTILELDQSFETPLTEYQRGPFRLRYAYARSKDCQDGGERGQDYLVWRAETHRAGFALCDGVGQSFLGGLASQIIGEVLIEWLWKLPLDETDRLSDPKILVQQLRKALDSKKQDATQIIQEKDFSSLESEMIREALESRREKRGTQSNFVCGVVDAPNKHSPKGKVRLFWLGDAKLQIWHSETNKSSLLNASWDKREAWSSKFGTSGEIHYFQGTLDELDCIIAHSDGVDPIEKKLSPMLSSDILAKGLKTLGDDDSSFLELHIGKSSIDIDDDLVSLVRNSPIIPVKIIKQIEIIKEPSPTTVVDVPKKPSPTTVVAVPKIPLYFKILFPMVVIFSSVISFLFGRMTIPSVPDVVPETSTPKLFHTAPPLPVWTQIFTETETSTPTMTPVPPIGVFLFSADGPKASLNQTGCYNLRDIQDYENSTHIEVHGTYILAGYSERDCRGDMVIKLMDGGSQSLEITIMSAQVDLIQDLPVP